MAYIVRWNHGQDDSSGLLDQARIIASQWMGHSANLGFQPLQNLHLELDPGNLSTPLRSSRLTLCLNSCYIQQDI